MGCGLRVAGKKGIVGRGQKADSRSQISDNRKQMTEDRRIGKSEPIQLTNSTDRDITRFYWGTESVILYMLDTEGDENYKLYSLNVESKETKYFLSNAPEHIHLEEMSRVCILRWPIEQCFKEGKSEVGMDHYEHRSWAAWHRHMTFVFIAQLFLLRLRHTFKKKPPH